VRQRNRGIAVVGLIFLALFSLGALLLIGATVWFFAEDGLSLVEAGTGLVAVGLLGVWVCIVLDS